MSDSVEKYCDMSEDFNCRVGRVYPVLYVDADNVAVIYKPEA